MQKFLLPYRKPKQRLVFVPHNTAAQHTEGKLQGLIGIYTCWAFGLTLDKSYIQWPSFQLPHQDTSRQYCLSSVFLQIKNLHCMQNRSFSAVLAFPSPTLLLVSACFKGQCKQTFKPVTGVPREACFCFIPGGWGLWPSAFPSLIWAGPSRQKSCTEPMSASKSKIH